MSTSDYNAEALWAYVHGESDTETRTAIEAALKSDSALAAAEHDIRALHACLKSGAPVRAISEEDLLSEITAAWEHDHETMRLAPDIKGDVETHDSTRRTRISIWHSGLAIAACLLIMMGVQTLRPPAALSWNAPTLMKSRGDASTAELYSEFEIEEMHGLLVEEVASAYDATGESDKRRKAWIFSTALNVRPDRSFTLSVNARNRYDATLQLSWDYPFDSMDDYRERVTQMADDVADGLAEEL